MTTLLHKSYLLKCPQKARRSKCPKFCPRGLWIAPHIVYFMPLKNFKAPNFNLSLVLIMMVPFFKGKNHREEKT